VTYFFPATDGKFQALGGDTYVAVVEFTDPVRAKVLLSYGNATQAGSRHVGDQIEAICPKGVAAGVAHPGRDRAQPGIP
jgi:acyl-homoserine-lactone acylase